MMRTYDPLAYLPRARVLDLPKRYSVYDPTRPPDHLYLVLAGRVKVFCTAGNGNQTLLRIVCPEGFFGESSLIPTPDNLRESAVVVEPAQVMSWSAEELEQQIAREPKLGMAFLECFGGNNILLRDRLAALALHKTGVRVMLALVELGRSMGTPTPEGALRVTGLTHQAIADYVGTSREIVTSEMNRLRQMGYVAYSRRFIDVFADALAEWLRQQGTILSRPATAGGTTLRATS